jgi:hypothetical protein
LKAKPKEIIAQRLKGYVFGQDGSRPFCDAAREEIEALMEEYHEFARYPSTPQLKNISDTDKLQSLKEQMVQWLPDDQYKELCEGFNQQIDSYANFIKTTVLPKSSPDTLLPVKIYKLLLKINGVDALPVDLIDQGIKDFNVTYEDYKKLANKIALEKSNPERYPMDNPGVVITSLMEDTALPDEKQILEMYNRVQVELEGFIRDDEFLTLPNTTLRMRTGTAAEEATFPVPHVCTPNFINNAGDTIHSWPEFVLCDLKGNASPVAAYALCAHEGRPGHDLQFSRMVEMMLKKENNLFETVLSSNSTNAEGWAHYVEYAMMHHYPLECQMGAYQDQLLRMSRMFLDPQLNLGMIKHEDVVEFHKTKLGLGDSMANSEANRYKFLMPAQAVTYRFGALKIMNFRDELKEKMGADFSMKRFHDSILSFGLLPLDIVKPWIEMKMM